MARFTKRKFFRVMLTTFKWCRVCVWTIILFILAGVLYLHLAGLPDYAKSRLLSELRARGIDARFSEMRLGWAHEILIQDVSFELVNDRLSQSVSAGGAEVKVDFLALLRRQVKIASFRIERGKASVPSGGPDGQALSLEDVSLHLRFMSNDCVRLENARGTLHGISLYVDGVLTNFSAVKSWKLGGIEKKSTSEPSTNVDWHVTLRQALAIADQVEFARPPELRVTFDGDARDVNSISSELRLAAAGVRTPWGELTNFNFKVDCSHIANPGAEPFAMLRVSADRVRTAWGGASQIDLRMAVSRSTNLAFLHGTVDLSASRLHAKWGNNGDAWGRMSRLDWIGAVDFNATNYAVKSAQGTLKVRSAESALGSIRQASIAFQASTNSAKIGTNLAWGVFSAAAPYDIDWQIEASGARTPALELKAFNSAGAWRGPDLDFGKLEAEVFDTQVKAAMHLDVASRRLQATLASDLNLSALGAHLGPAIQKKLSEVKCQGSPKIAANASLTLPAWALSGVAPNSASAGASMGIEAPDWMTNLLRSLTGSATVSAGKCAYQKIGADSVGLGLSFSNSIVYLNRLEVHRPDGDVLVTGSGNSLTGDYAFMVDSQLDPKGLIKDLVDLGDQEIWLTETQLAHPPKIHAVGKGNWNDFSTLSARSSLELTNFVALGQPFGSFTASLEYSNLVLNASNVRIIQGDQFVTVPLLKYDFSHNIMTFVNGVGKFDPRRVFRSLGDILPEFLHQIAFESAPEAKVNGWFSIDDPEAVDLVFQVSGEHFRWTNEINLWVDRISGIVDWKGREVNLTDVQANLYGGGSGGGKAYFDWRKEKGTLTTFDVGLTNIDLNTLVHGLSGEPTDIDGKLDGTVVCYGNCSYNDSWHGDGNVIVHDARLWDIPIFGIIISPLLNSINDGLGNNRGHEAIGTFVLTNGVIHTDDLSISASKGLTLLYRGDANLKKIDARVEARMLRNMPILGPAISILLTPVTKTLEWRVTGTLRDPVAKPAYPPGYILDRTLHPLRTLKNLIPGAATQLPAPVDSSGTSPFEPKVDP